MRIGQEPREVGRGEGEQSCCCCFFFPPCWLVLYCTGLGYTGLGGSGFCCQFPEHKDPFFSCQSQPDVPRLVLRILIPHSVLLFSSKRVIRVTTHTLTKLGGAHILTHRQKCTQHTHSVTGMHANTAWLRHCNHRGQKGIPEQEWAPITLV